MSAKQAMLPSLAGIEIQSVPKTPLAMPHP
jgi:hypothetical protein